MNPDTLTPGSLYIEKDAKTGLWKWLGAPTNNFRDREQEILTAAAHQRFVNLFDSKEFERLTGMKSPELWVWHVPVAIGNTEMLAYDQRGFLIAAGFGFQGEFYDQVFEALSKSKKPLGMSHGMPRPFVGYNRTDKSLIEEYLSTEFTTLPWEWAANLITPWGVQKEAKVKAIEEHKKPWFKDTFGEAIVAEFDARLDSGVIAAKSAHLDQKGMNMNETPDPEEDEEEDDGAKKEAVSAPVTVADLQAVVAEITKGVSDGVQALVAPLQESNAALAKQVASLSKRVEAAEKNRGQTIADAIKETPVLSLSASMAKSIVGSSATRLKSREAVGKKPSAGKQQKSALGFGAGLGTGVGSLDSRIMRQQKAALTPNSFAGDDDDFEDED